MQIVIDIDENIFTRLFDNDVEDYAIINDDLFAIAKSIRNCTPLPKGHGRLIDADKIQSEFVCTHNGDFECVSSRPCSKCPDSQCYMDIESASTIIEADKER